MHATCEKHGWHAAPALHEILILDDSEFDRRRLTRTIARGPMLCNVTEVEDLAALGQALTAKRFDVILIDYALTDGTGLEALERCRASRGNRHALYVMVTGNDSSSLAVDALKSGFDEYLPKDEIDFSTLAGFLTKSHRKRRSSAAQSPSSPFLDFALRDAAVSGDPSQAATQDGQAVSETELHQAAQAVSTRLEGQGFGTAFVDLFDAPEPGFEFKPSGN